MFSFFICSPNLEGVRFGFRLFDLRSELPKGVSSASSSGCPRVVGGSQGWNLDKSAALKNGAISAPGDNKIGACGVKKELVVRLRWSLLLVVPSSVALNLVSYKGCRDGTRIEMRMVGRDWVRPDLISHEFLAWYKPHVGRPVLIRSSSLDVGLPTRCAGSIPRSASEGGDDRLHIGRLQFFGVEGFEHQFDDTFVRSYGYPGSGRQSFLS